MATEALEIRMARLEGAYEQINERLGSVEREIGALRSEQKTELGSIRSEIGGLRSEIKSENSYIRRKMDTQFYWLLSLVLGSMLIPILRDLAVVR